MQSLLFNTYICISGTIEIITSLLPSLSSNLFRVCKKHFTAFQGTPVQWRQQPVWGDDDRALRHAFIQIPFPLLFHSSQI
jgi:hypothetical protein